MVDLYAAAAMFPALFLLIFLGIPVAFALIVTALIFGAFQFGPAIGVQAFRFIYDVASSYVLAAIPLFVLMGHILERSGLAENLYRAMQLWVGRVPGGLAVTTIAMCTVFAAGSGIVGAVEALIGLMAIGPMVRMKYDRGLIAGTICAGGSLGTIIPPSVVVVIYGSIANVSIGKLFAGVLIPGLLMALLFLGYIVGRCYLRPTDGPVIGRSDDDVPLFAKIRITIFALVPPLLLIVAVIGSIMIGLASPTEAAGLGAVGALGLSVLYGKFRFGMLIDAIRSTLVVNAMIMFIVVGGTLFTSIFRVNGGSTLVLEMISLFDLSEFGVVVLLLAIIFVLGFVLDWTSVVLISIPIFLPLLDSFGIDTLWFGVACVCVIQTSYLTPPFAPSIFYLRAIAPAEFTYRQMYTGVLPFVACQLLIVLLILFFPRVANWLPSFL